ncbi:GMP synthase [mine drainage metagenome]|uniref:GMP synthase n=1 Tax=mine drainage metagenome TaxID=410659 RepID=A0A1J5QC90_9ZZZZ
MKPVAVFRHAPTEGPGYLAEFLDRRAIPWQLIRIDAGDALPDTVTGYSGLVFMGGPMSVNDELPWIAQALQLIRQAVAAGIPVLGHCLGGQLMSKALGGVVTRNPVKEIGWAEVHAAQNDAASRWFGDIAGFTGFHWHGETFSIPEGATGLLSSAHCRNQAFAIGKHLGFQCHIEMTAEMVHSWCAHGGEEISRSKDSPGVQTVAEIERDLEIRVSALNRVAERVYAAWAENLAF